MHKRPIYKQIIKRLKEPRKFIQVLLGPRQVGKTTLSLQVSKDLGIPNHYVTADTATLKDLSWLETQWEIARQKAKAKQTALFVIDEVQKIPHWSDLIKKLWDEDSQNNISLKVIILGSSPWLMQKGLTESLAGRFEILPITHWNYSEMIESFNWDLDEYIYFGGYPGAASLADKNDVTRWVNYINDSLIETTISRDILLMTQVNKPALLRRLFQLGCSYSGQILSYQKMVGQLQDAGNTTTLAHYLELLSGAGILKGIDKYANDHSRKRASSPKFQVYNTALMSALSGKTFQQAKQDKDFWGRLTESAIGSYLVNESRGKQMDVFYWREGSQEVDFIVKKENILWAIEVKSGEKKGKFSGMDSFKKSFPQCKLLLVGKGGIPIDEFLKAPINKWFS